ncbi:GntR family transcriptional regulator [Thalassospira mesophila]|uniref:GntR family transcriptional regulator n=1 Tax=Thalassospira mesophila TaxID=1293891 RepID=A0A1Y2KVD9_9PROT|nr:GntR family transcriptional regulator [Thalassospira mesophila]OSQ35228.1 GntR family transcriptional regulator [Thalassospira mesophila]
MNEPFKALKQEAAPLRNKILHALRRAIETGYLQPGTRLVEKDLCEKLGVSRTSLREALRQLQTEGILTDLHNRGLTVITVSPEEAENIYRIRGVLEPLIVEQFIENAPDAEINGLKEQSKKLTSAYRDGSAEDIVAAKRDFYDLICSGARNQIAFDILKRLTLLTSPLRRVSVIKPDRRQQSIREIEQIVETIAKRDKAAAHKAAENHVANSARSALARAKEDAANA